MASNFLKNFSKDVMFNILKKYYPNFNITYPISSDNNSSDIIISSVLNEENNSELFVMFCNYECKFLYDSTFEANAETFDKLRIEFLAEMVKCFGKNTEYMQGLNDFYNNKIKYGYDLLKIYSDRQDIKEMAEKEINEAKLELEFLTSIKIKKQELEK